MTYTPILKANFEIIGFVCYFFLLQKVFYIQGDMILWQ
ncbi:MAG: hypothetical protein JWN60_498 [Acidobacteria bacterium]|jgi:hypothetical protein|nr:hypothetical protein [Acidobacteriota bacterium]